MTRGLTVARNVARPIWITEIGWSTATNHPDGVSEQQQATFVRQAIERALGEWGGFVQRIFLYQWDRSNGIMSDREGNFGLRRADGGPKAALHALAALSSGGRPGATRALSSRNEHGALALSLHPSQVHGTGPAPLPRWFWAWKSWRLGHGKFKRQGAADPRARPSSAPRRIPGWAWTRVRLPDAGRRVLVRGRVLARSVPARREVRWAATHDRRAVTVYRLTRRGWRPLAKVGTTKEGRFEAGASVTSARRPVLMRAVARYRVLSVRSPIVRVHL
jgi:hypothetical protein